LTNTFWCVRVCITKEGLGSTAGAASPTHGNIPDYIRSVMIHIRSCRSAHIRSNQTQGTSSTQPKCRRKMIPRKPCVRRTDRDDVSCTRRRRERRRSSPISKHPYFNISATSRLPNPGNVHHAAEMSPANNSAKAMRPRDRSRRRFVHPAPPGTAPLVPCLNKRTHDRGD
jgi:hypothetical protein